MSMDQDGTYRPSLEALTAYFSGELSSKEEEKIDQWKADSDDNQEEFEAMHRVWLDLGLLRIQDVEVDLSQAFDQVKQKKENSVLTWRDSRLSWILKVAATVILVSSLVLLFWDQSPELMVHQVQEVEKIALSDGSRVTLNEGASLTFPETFSDEERRVNLIGEAFFDVAHDPDQPFRVEAEGVTITVLGTSFNVQSDGQFVRVSVSTGRVEVATEFETEVLEAGDHYEVDLGRRSAEKMRNSSSGTENYWHSQKLIFEGVALAEVISDLEQVFNVDVEVSTAAILSCRLQATFEGQSLQEILEIIALSQELTISTENERYILSGEGCEN